MGSVRLENVGKTYPDGTCAVRDVTLEVADGEFVVFVGPSGCGKSTLLRMIAGLEDVTTGSIVLADQPINGVPPRDRDIAMVFQNYALYPQMTVRQNIGFALKQRKLPKAEIDERVSATASILDLGGLLDRKPKQLSGGQQQRVAMGRAIVREPQVFLLDEPLSNLDAKLRVQMRSELGQLHARLGVTTIHVTHDQVEAMTLGDRVAVFADGRLQQYDTPHTLYHTPANLFVGAFVGSPAMNLADGTVIGDSPPTVKLGPNVLDLDTVRKNLVAKQRVVVGFRPEDIRWARSKEEQPGSPTFVARVELVEHVEPESYVMLSLPESEIVIRSADEFLDAGGGGGQTPSGPPLVSMRVRADDAPTVGEEINIEIRRDRIHLFDAATGLAL